MGPSTTPVIYLYLFSTNFTKRTRKKGTEEGVGREDYIVRSNPSMNDLIRD